MYLYGELKWRTRKMVFDSTIWMAMKCFFKLKSSNAAFEKQNQKNNIFEMESMEQNLSFIVWLYQRFKWEKWKNLSNKQTNKSKIIFFPFSINEIFLNMKTNESVACSFKQTNPTQINIFHTKKKSSDMHDEEKQLSKIRRKNSECIF